MNATVSSKSEEGLGALLNRGDFCKHLHVRDSEAEKHFFLPYQKG
ncbi:hypothetical protein ACS127_16575 [Amphibacillus sp. Q70]